MSDAAPLTSVAVPPTETPSSELGTWSSSAERGLPAGIIQRAVDTAAQPGQATLWSHPAEPTAGTPASAAARPSRVQRRVEAGVEPVQPTALAPLVSDSAPMASAIPPAAMPSAQPGTRSGSAGPSPLRFVQRAVNAFLQRAQRTMRSPSPQSTATTPAPAAAARGGAAPSAVPPVGRSDITQLVSDSEPIASTDEEPPTQRGVDTVQRVADTVQHVAASGPLVAELPLALADHSVVGLVGDRPIEPVVPDHPPDDNAAGETARRSVTATPGVPATTAVQRSASAGGFPVPPRSLDLPAVRRSFPGVKSPESPSQPIQFVQFVPAALTTVVTGHPTQQSTGLTVQRSDGQSSATATPETTAPVTVDSAAGVGAPAITDPAAATGSGQPTGSTSPTEIDNLVRRLYDPIVRRLRAELQLDRERAGRSLDLWH
ncbi:MAG: hypothetical protein ACRDS0_21900 [Pseudonocardiaceae bacterium]